MYWTMYLGDESLALAARMVTLTFFYAIIAALPLLGTTLIVRRRQRLAARRVQVRRRPRRTNPVQIIW